MVTVLKDVLGLGATEVKKLIQHALDYENKHNRSEYYKLAQKSGKGPEYFEVLAAEYVGKEIVKNLAADAGHYDAVI
jgi:hypothetical protein